ncbi:MAG: peptidoglycan-binding domain-containing protein [Polyangiaceae bacterium]
MAQFEHNSAKFGYLNLEDMTCVQQALSKLGYSPGDADGKDGPKTREAVKQFQTKAVIGIDGIVGSETRKALVSELDRQSAPAVS